MNLLVLELSELLVNSTFKLQGRKAKHIVEILKSKPGEVLNAGLYNDSKGFFYIEKISIQKNEIIGTYRIKEKQSNIKEETKFQLISSLQRPQTIKKILQLSASTGVENIFFLFRINRKSLI